MANYDFRSLSPHDFELLCRDLLQESIGIRLESFSTGPDSGIDFRYRAGSENLIVQCKHYLESGFDALCRALKRRERGKLENLNPTRYILTTSVSLTPRKKKNLLDILSPYCGSEGDIFGRDDINNLLGMHPVIEQRHFKLWLTSAGVLERIIHSGIFRDSDAHLERARLRLSRYVPNRSFGRAKRVLDANHYCIIAGIPGIGKTTLAEVLLADLVDRHGFTAFRIDQNLSELRPVKNPMSRQVFYFDDFLGKTSLDKLKKNEDQRLLELMEEVAENPNWRFILTTREYILNIAKQRYESFAHPSINFSPCVVSLSDYTRQVRAKILYNYIYFSDLSKDHKLALLESHGYKEILSHQNYNPRVVEYMTKSQNTLSVTPTLYRREFLDSLNNPERIWEHAFRYQVSESARHLLLVLTTLPYVTRLSDLEKAFSAFYEYRRKRFGFSTAAGDFEDAVRELEGNFISSRKLGDEIVVSFHNPSVKDFMEHFLDTSDSDVSHLGETACFFEQYISLWNGIKGRRYKGVDRARDKFVQSMKSNLHAVSARFFRQADSLGEIIGIQMYQLSKESRVEFYLRVIDELRVDEAPIESVLKPLEEDWQEGKADREDLVSLLQMLTERELGLDGERFRTARMCILTSAEEVAHFRAAIRFLKAYPEEGSDEDWGQLRSMFRKFAREYSEEWGGDSDPDWLREVAGNLEEIGSSLQVPTDQFTEDLYEKAEEIERERAEDEPPEENEEDWNEELYFSQFFENEAGMFDSLKNALIDN